MIGYGTKDKTPIECIQYAIDNNYKLIDTKNTNRSLGQYKKLKFDRSSVMICSKFVGEENKEAHNPKMIFNRCLDSLKKAGLKYWDVYYMHTTYSYNSYNILDTYDELLKLKEDGYILNVGLSNITLDQLRAVCYNRNKPDYIQIEIHPYLTENKILDYCLRNGIKVVAHSPFGSNVLFKKMNNDKVLKDISNKYNRSVYSIILKWHISRGIIPIPSSKNKVNIENNINLDFDLHSEDVLKITNMNKNHRVYIKPNHNDYRYKLCNTPYPKWIEKDPICKKYKNVLELANNGYIVDKLYILDNKLYDICSCINMFINTNRNILKKETLYERDYQTYYKNKELIELTDCIKNNKYLNTLAENYLNKKKITKQIYVCKNELSNDLLAKHSCLYHRDSQKQPNMKVVIYLNDVNTENGCLNLVTNEKEINNDNVRWYLEKAFRNKTPRTTKEELLDNGYIIKPIIGTQYTCIIFDGTVVHNGGHIYKGYRESIYIEYF
jgi:diketogulonate reductase-like aldo/keto reductase